MQSVGSGSWNGKADYFRTVLYSSMASLPILSVMIIGILPALKSEAFATGPAGQAPSGRATAVASARVIKPFTMDTLAASRPGTGDSATAVLRRTTIRSCASLLGANVPHGAEANCELRLIELQ